MYTARVEAGFAAAHFLAHYHGKCERLHGHNYRVRVTARGSKLDEGGMLVDFGVLKSALRGILEYNTDLFNASTIKRLLRHFEMLLQAIAADAFLPISDLTILPTDEKESILRHWNDFDRQYDLNTCIHRLFEEQAAKTPSSVAVVFENQTLTYSELNRKANKLAAHLKNLGIGPDIKVSICLDKCIDLPIAVLGTLKAGGAYVPVDPTYPEDRILYMLQNSEAAAVLSHKKYAPILSQQDSLIFYLDEQWPQIEGLSSENPQEYPDADNLAYRIYTSGSTGKAKGTMVAHKSIVNAYRAWEEDYHLRNGVNSHLWGLTTSESARSAPARTWP